MTNQLSLYLFRLFRVILLPSPQLHCHNPHKFHVSFCYCNLCSFHSCSCISRTYLDITDICPSAEMSGAVRSHIFFHPWEHIWLGSHLIFCTQQLVAQIKYNLEQTQQDTEVRRNGFLSPAFHGTWLFLNRPKPDTGAGVQALMVELWQNSGFSTRTFILLELFCSKLQNTSGTFSVSLV